MNHKVNEVVDYIRSNYASVRSVRELTTNELGQNYEVFRKEFRKAVGISPMKFLRQVRVERAKVLLINSTLKHYAIGRETGYKNEVTFCRFFKRQAGITPSSYRRANGNTQHEKNK